MVKRKAKRKPKEIPVPFEDLEVTKEPVSKDLLRKIEKVRNVIVIEAKDYMESSVAKMFIERNKLAKRRKVSDYVI